MLDNAAVADPDNTEAKKKRNGSAGPALPVVPEAPANPRKRTLNGGHDPREMAKRSAEVRRRKRDEREAAVLDRIARLDNKAVNALVDGLNSSDPAVKQRSAIYLLDRILGKPTMRQETEHSGTLDIAANPEETRQWLVAKLGNPSGVDDSD